MSIEPTDANAASASVSNRPTGAGLGLRRGLLTQLLDLDPSKLDFLELAPENWIAVGGAYGRQFRALSERFELVCHGLSLSIGSPAPLDTEFLKQVKQFLDEHQVQTFSEHLSFCSDDKGHLYDLMPMPFTPEAVTYLAGRITQVQDLLQRRIAIEHISYYAAPGQQMSEIEFVCAVLSAADCDLLLDVNNIYVNSVNFGYNASEFLTALPSERIAYIHTAGHFQEAEDLLIDTHGSDVSAPVWALLKQAYAKHGVRGTLLERDFNFPPMAELLGEVEKIQHLQHLQHLQRKQTRPGEQQA